MKPFTFRLLCGAASFAIALPAHAKSCDDDGALYYLGNTSGDAQSIWLSRTVPKGNFRLEAAQQQRLVDRWSRDRPSLRLSLSDSVSQGNGGTHKLYVEGDKPNDDCLIATQNQKLNFTLPPEFVRPPQKPGNNLPFAPHLPGGLLGDGSRPDQTLPTVPPAGVMPGLPSPPPTGVMPGLPSPPPSGVMPGLPSPPPTGVMPGLPSPPPTGVMPGLPSRPDQTLPTVPPTGVMPGLPSPPPTGVMPGLPSRPDQTLPTVPPTGVMPGLPSPPPTGVMPGLPSRPDQTLPTVPPTGVMPGLPSPPPTGVMPGLPSRPDQTLPTVPPTGVMPGLPSPPPTGVMPGLPSRPDQTLPTVPPTGVMPGLPSPPPTGVMPGLPSRPDQTLPTVPPTGVMPGLPSPPPTGVMPGLPSPPDQTLPTVPPTGVMPGLPSPPPTGVMPGLPPRPDQTLPTVPPTGVMPGLPSPPPTGVMPGLPSRPDQTLPTVPPTGVMPGLPSRPDQKLPTVPPIGVMPARPPLPGTVQPPSLQPEVPGIDLGPRERVVERPCPDRLLTDEDDPELDERCRAQSYTEGRSDLDDTLWDAWTDFRISRISQSGRLDGVDGHVFMASAGLDRRVAGGLIIGVSAMYNESRSESVDGGLDSQATGFLFGPYLAWGFAPHLTLNFSANWGWTDSDVRLAGLATHLGTDVLSLSADVTLDTHLAGLALRPRAGISYTHSEHPAHVLTGALLGRSIQLLLPGDASDLASAEQATEAAWPIALEGGRLAVPFLELGAKYDFERPGGASFDTANYRIVSPGELSGYAEGGVRLVLGGHFSAELSGAYRSIGVDGQDIWEGRLFLSLAF